MGLPACSGVLRRVGVWISLLSKTVRRSSQLIFNIDRTSDLEFFLRHSKSLNSSYENVLQTSKVLTSYCHLCHSSTCWRFESDWSLSGRNKIGKSFSGFLDGNELAKFLTYYPHRRLFHFRGLTDTHRFGHECHRILFLQFFWKYAINLGTRGLTDKRWPPAWWHQENRNKILNDHGGADYHRLLRWRYEGPEMWPKYAGGELYGCNG